MKFYLKVSQTNLINNFAHAVYLLFSAAFSPVNCRKTPNNFGGFALCLYNKKQTLMEATRTSITVKTTVDASIEKVWNAWLKPEHITQWNHASNDWHTTAAKNDVRIGGKFSATMAAKDGSASFEFEGVYKNLKTHQLIEYTIADGRSVKIVFESIGSKVQVTETFDAENENPIELQRGGWQAILDNFKKYTEKLK
jgi:uncharacterized protein YndB with AHSA1/START domain